MDSPIIVAAIEAADLPAPIYRTARRLLDLASHDGHVTLSKDEMAHVCGTTSWGTVRGHLTQLATVGLIHYSTNSAVYVNFTRADYAPTRAEHANDATPTRADYAPTRAEHAQDHPSRAERAPVMAEHAPARAQHANQSPLGKVGRKVGINTNDQSYLPTLDDLTDEQRRAVALLTDPDVGLVEASAIEHALQHDWEHILRIVAGWWADVDAGRVTGPGALHTRLARNWAPGPIHKNFRRSKIYYRHAVDDYPYTAIGYADLENLDEEPDATDPDDEPEEADPLIGTWKATLDYLSLDRFWKDRLSRGRLGGLSDQAAVIVVRDEEEVNFVERLRLQLQYALNVSRIDIEVEQETTPHD